MNFSTATTEITVNPPVTIIDQMFEITNENISSIYILQQCQEYSPLITHKRQYTKSPKINILKINCTANPHQKGL